MTDQEMNSAQYLKSERMGMFSQFFDQAFLKASEALLLLSQRRKRLDIRHKQVFPERQAEDVQILTTVTERTGQSDKHWWEQRNTSWCMNENFYRHVTGAGLRFPSCVHSLR